MLTTSTKLRPAAIKTLKKVKEIILENPENFNMAAWHMNIGDPMTTKEVRKNSCILSFKNCKTTHCIAGWVQMIIKKKGNAESVAEKYLGVDCSSLFHAAWWSEPFMTKYYSSLRVDERAKIAGQVIDWFIKENS